MTAPTHGHGTMIRVRKALERQRCSPVRLRDQTVTAKINAMKTYAPKPLDTASINLSARQQRLVRDLAENVHEVWAAKRIADGWSWGPRRDDHRKQHPCLVPYDDLPESEKSYDRTVVEETIKAAIALGFSIVPKT